MVIGLERCDEFKVEQEKRASLTIAQAALRHVSSGFRTDMKSCTSGSACRQHAERTTSSTVLRFPKILGVVRYVLLVRVQPTAWVRLYSPRLLSLTKAEPHLKAVRQGVYIYGDSPGGATIRKHRLCTRRVVLLSELGARHSRTDASCFVKGDFSYWRSYTK